MTTPQLRNSINRSPLRLAFLLIPLVLACFGLSPIAQAADGDVGGANTSEGAAALQSLTTGIHNTALGGQALFSNTTGSYNTATGSQALKNNTGDDNTADGFQALAFNTGDFNAATGWRALFSNTIGDQNTANGYKALYHNTTGSANTANGGNALLSTTTGGGNTATGVGALSSNTGGSFDTAYGFNALFTGASGGFNTAIGALALEANTGFGNIALGISAGDNLTTGDNNIDIGNEGVAAESDTIRIGTGQSATFIAGISGVAISGPAVVVNSSGQLGVAPSSKRFKDEIKPMDKASEALLALRSVTFRYKHEIDPKGTPQFGLVAEEVAAVNPDLVVRNDQGEVYTVRYEAVNAMLLNEFLKEHRKVEQHEATIAQLKSTVAQQQKDFIATTAQQKEIQAVTASLKEQASQIQKVSAQLEMSKAAPQTVLNNQ